MENNEKNFNNLKREKIIAHKFPYSAESFQDILCMRLIILRENIFPMEKIKIWKLAMGLCGRKSIKWLKSFIFKFDKSAKGETRFKPLKLFFQVHIDVIFTHPLILYFSLFWL